MLEDDVDWDIRIRPQMRDFARASRLLIQPLQDTSDEYLDSTNPQPSTDQEHEDIFIDIGGVKAPTTSPYGDINRGDVLWLGHCGNRLPRPSDGNTPLGRVPLHDDETVPEYQHLDLGFSNDDLLLQYPEHIRVVARARHTTCSLAYGISLGGARRIMWELGVRNMSVPFDIMSQYICDGTEGRELGMCLSVQPQLFQHNRPAGLRAVYSDL